MSGLIPSSKQQNSSSSGSSSSVQQFLDIAEIKDSVVVLKDGSLHMVLAVSSINFDLKSDTEQEAIIFGYQRFLNSLDFPIQILITTRKFDIKPYIQMLEGRKETERNILLRNQIDDYANFVNELVKVSNIMSKLFYIIVPFYVIESKDEGFIKRVLSSLQPRKVVFQKREEFETYKSQLLQRVDGVREALAGTGIRLVPLESQELIELYYNYFNPSEFEHINIPELSELNLE